MGESMPKRIEMVYRDALDQIAFFKKQQWVVVGYGIAVHAALYTVATHLDPSTPNRFVLVLLALVTALYGTAVLLSFTKGMSKFRSRLDWIYENYFGEAERVGLHLGQARSPVSEMPFFWPLSAALLFGALLVTLLILPR